MNQSPLPLFEDDKVREELVAYLDGELSPDDAQRVERRLAEDTTYRQALQELEKTWDLLDTLPRAEPGDEFTRTTVEMVALSAAAEVEQLKLQARRRHRLALAASVAAVIAGALAGFGAVYWKVTEPNRQLVRDLPVLENMEYYRHADSLEFLRRLEQEGLFDGEVSDALPE